MTITSPLLGPQSPAEEKVFAQEAEKFDREIADAITDLRAENATLRAQIAEAEARGVQVKPLVWETDAGGQKWATAFGVKDFYGICFGRVYIRGHFDSTVDPTEDGVYADYEARVRSCLIDAPPDEYTRGRIAGLKEAASKSLSALWPILGGNQLDAETWQDISDAFSVALIGDA